MEQPFNLKIVETKRKILNVIQEAQLPAVVIQMALREITTAVDGQVQGILQNEKLEYEKSLKENKEA